MKMASANMCQTSKKKRVLTGSKRVIFIRSSKNKLVKLYPKTMNMLYHQRKTERMQLGRNIKSLRGLKGFPLKYVATELGMSISNLSNIENGITGIEQKTLFKLGQVLGVEPKQIQVFNPEIFFKIGIND